MNNKYYPKMRQRIRQNKCIYFLVGIFIILSYSSANSYSADDYSLTPAQKHFTSIISGLPGIVSVSWESPVSLWIKVSSRAVGSPPDPKKASDLARTLSDRGMTALRQPLCIHIYQNKKNELAKSCVYF